MKYLNYILCISILFFIAADYKTYNQPNIKSNRTSTTTKFGTGTITRRSDGSVSQTQKFGSGYITTERTSDGKVRTGITSNSMTRWNDGTVTTHTKIGSNNIITQKHGNKTINGYTRNNKYNSTTNWSNGSSNTNIRTGQNSYFNIDKK